MAKVSDVLDGAQLDEPVTTLPEHAAGGGSHEDIVAGAYAEGELEATFAGLADKDTLTVDDLRTAAGNLAEGMSDEDLIAAYKAAEAGGGTTDDDEPEAESAFKLPFPIYDAAGVKIEDVSKITVQDLLSGKVQVEYQAMGKAQRKAFADLVRTASNGHYNEQKMGTLMQERGQAVKQLQDMRTEHESWAGDRKLWNKALDAAIAGNIEPLRAVIQAYAAELGRAPADAPIAAAADDPAMVAEGQRFVLENSQRLASEYAGANPVEIQQVLLHMIGQEPAEFLTREKLENMVQYELPRVIEGAGYSRNGQPATTAVAQGDGDPRDARITALEAKLTELTATTANAATQRLRARSKLAPPAGGGSVSSAGDSVPAMKSREDMKRWLRGETGA